MQRLPVVMSNTFMRSNTQMRRARMNDAIAYGKKLETDPDAAARMEVQLCKVCYYGTQVAGQAVTSQPCMSCHQLQFYGTTMTDALCQPCAVAGALCKRCASDVDLDIARTEWPIPTKILPVTA